MTFSRLILRPPVLAPGEIKVVRRNRLGRGAFGDVFGGFVGGEDGVTIPCAVKEQQPQDEEGEKKLAMELAVHREVRGKHLVKLLGEGRRGPVSLVALELCRGDLADDKVNFLGVGKTPAGLIKGLGWVADVLEGLVTFHTAGYVHRDVKPENCFVRANGEVVLGDFGLVRRLGEADGLIGGTPGFIAPEVLRLRCFDGKADLWSIGVMLYSLVSGIDCPYFVKREDEEPNGAYVRRLRDLAELGVTEEMWRVPRVAGLSFGLKGLIGSLLEVDPEDRPTAVEALATLRRAIASEEFRLGNLARGTGKPSASATPRRGLRPFLLGAGPGLRPLRLAAAARPANPATAPRRQRTPAPVPRGETTSSVSVASASSSVATPPLPSPAPWFACPPHANRSSESAACSSAFSSGLESSPCSTPVSPSPAALLSGDMMHFGGYNAYHRQTSGASSLCLGTRAVKLVAVAKPTAWSRFKSLFSRKGES